VNELNECLEPPRKTLTPKYCSFEQNFQNFTLTKASEALFHVKTKAKGNKFTGTFHDDKKVQHLNQI